MTAAAAEVRQPHMHGYGYTQIYTILLRSSAQSYYYCSHCFLIHTFLSQTHAHTHTAEKQTRISLFIYCCLTVLNGTARSSLQPILCILRPHRSCHHFSSVSTLWVFSFSLMMYRSPSNSVQPEQQVEWVSIWSALEYKWAVRCWWSVNVCLMSALLLINF